MSDLLVPDMMNEEDFLEHYGVKGQKWGVLREQASAGSKSAQKKLDKADKNWQKSSMGTKAYIEVNNRVADKMNNGGIEKFNSNPKYKNIKDFRDDNDPKVKEYFKDYEKLSSEVWAETTKEIYGDSPSGRYSCAVKTSADGYKYAEMVDNLEVQHAETNTFRVKLILDANGKIIRTGETVTEDMLQHNGMFTEDDFLEHYGKKGMKWGVTRATISNTVSNKVSAVKANRELNKASRAKDRDAHKESVAKKDAEIDAARMRLRNREHQQVIKSAKKDFKKMVSEVGSREARKAIQELKQKKFDDEKLAALNKSGRETTLAVIASIGATLISAY